MGVRLSTVRHQIDDTLRIRDLEASVKELKAENNGLRREIMASLRQRSKDLNGLPQSSEISSAQVELFVEKLMNNPETNLGYVPDFLERPMEVKTITYLLNALAHTIDSSHIEFMGHEVVMRLQPSTLVALEKADEAAAAAREPYSSFDDDDYEGGVATEKRTMDPVLPPQLKNDLPPKLMKMEIVPPQPNESAAKPKSAQQQTQDDLSKKILSSDAVATTTTLTTNEV